MADPFDGPTPCWIDRFDRPRDLNDAAWAAFEAEVRRGEQAALSGDLSAVVGATKCIVESLCRIVLNARAVPWTNSDDFPKLVSDTQKAIERHPSGLANDETLR